MPELVGATASNAGAVLLMSDVQKNADWLARLDYQELLDAAPDAMVLLDKESVDSTPQTTIDALPEMLAKLGVLLEDDDAGAVDFTHDTALKTLRQLMQQFIADSNG